MRVENHCRELRNVQREVSTADANRLHRRRYLSRSLHGDGSMTISVKLPKESSDLVMKTLEMALQELNSEGDTFEGEQSPANIEETETDKERDDD